MTISDAIDRAIWALDEDWLRTLRGIAIGEGEGPEAVAARLGRPLQNAQDVSVRNGVAVIPLVGPIFRYANLFTQVSGATSIEIFARDLRVALDDPQVKAILLEINSPGGQVDGVNEAADMIAAAEKPIVAYVGGTAASAAYWLASAADRIVVDATARLGSIGVVTTVNVDKNAKDGTVEIVSSQSPNKRADVTTAEGRSVVQAQVDSIADVFIDAVAANRGVSRDVVIGEFGGGSVKIGRAAIAAGMADSAGSLESTLATLAAGYVPRRRRKMGANADSKMIAEADHKVAVDKALEDGMKLGLDEGRKTGFADGAKAERERILGIERVAIPGHDALVAELKADGKTSPAEAAMKINETEKLTRERRLEAIRKDGLAPAPAAAPTASGDPKPTAEDANAPIENRAKATWESDPKVREEFVSFESYLAFRKAEASGRVRVLRQAS